MIGRATDGFLGRRLAFIAYGVPSRSTSPFCALGRTGDSIPERAFRAALRCVCCRVEGEVVALYAARASRKNALVTRHLQIRAIASDTRPGDTRVGFGREIFIVAALGSGVRNTSTTLGMGVGLRAAVACRRYTEADIFIELGIIRALGGRLANTETVDIVAIWATRRAIDTDTGAILDEVASLAVRRGPGNTEASLGNQVAIASASVGFNTVAILEFQIAGTRRGSLRHAKTVVVDFLARLAPGWFFGNTLSIDEIRFAWACRSPQNTSVTIERGPLGTAFDIARCLVLGRKDIIESQLLTHREIQWLLRGSMG